MSCGLMVAGCGQAVNPGADKAFAEALAKTAQPGATPGTTAMKGWPNAAAAPHRLTIASTIQLVVDGATHRLQLRRVVDRGDAGAYRVVDSRTWSPPATTEAYTEGREAVFDGQRFATRRAGGPWIERETMDGGPGAMLRETYDVAPAIMTAFADYMVERHDPAADEQLAGRDVQWFAVSGRAGVAPMALDQAALHALRDHDAHWTSWLAATHRPTTIKGAVARAKGSRELLAGKLEISGDAAVDGVTGEFMLRFDYALDKPDGAVSFALPENLMAPRRTRLWHRIQRVLGDDLRPPYDRAPTSSPRR